MMVSLSFVLFVFFWLLILRLLLGSIEDDKLYVGMGQSYSIMFCCFCGVSNVLAMMYCKDVWFLYGDGAKCLTTMRSGPGRWVIWKSAISD